ncbi:hypothetical protein CIY_30310 [Butyrivibrio fibrisolvens 16/4]|nr:hypothetical protein CIY_30310 [Butyrivibrio fibrisolvens 16/4]
MTEVLERGTNEHFKTAADFMGYFQSLYPASDSLTKQVQRAVKALGMPKDEKGYFIINKTEDQLNQDKEIAFLLKKQRLSFYLLVNMKPFFSKLTANTRIIYISYFPNLIPLLIRLLP